VLSVLLGFSRVEDADDSQNMLIDGDPFPEHGSSNPVLFDEMNSAMRYRIADFCIHFIVTGPSLQSSSSVPTRDQELCEMFLRCAETKFDEFVLIFPALLRYVRSKALNLSAEITEGFVDALGTAMVDYKNRRRESVHHLVPRFLCASLHVWSAAPVTSPKVKRLCNWLLKGLSKGAFLSWQLRDATIIFLHSYMIIDPLQSLWTSFKGTDNGSPPVLPGTLLPSLCNDHDIRIRIRCAVFSAELLEIARKAGQTDMTSVYAPVVQSFGESIDTSKYVH
jgi:hypothetical protein